MPSHGTEGRFSRRTRCPRMKKLASLQQGECAYGEVPPPLEALGQGQRQTRCNNFDFWRKGMRSGLPQTSPPCDAMFSIGAQMIFQSGVRDFG